MDNDDRQVGRILSRREVIALLGVATPTTAATATPTPTGTVPACVVRPEVTEGPYFVDEMLNRSDIRSDPTTGVVKDGALLALTFNVSQITSGSCTALEGAQVDVWHCDATGIYSDVSDPGFNTSSQKFLRGYQLTDANGLAGFTTIYPGWYSSRAVHIHFKIRLTTASNQSYEFTSQLFFDDAFTDQVYTQAPYASEGQRDTLNSNDNIYQDSLLLTVTQTSQGYAATFDIGIQ
jgi:protocatechuate 3,4-dioxygenase beta subunit